jgi:histidinol-phosphatase
VHPDLTLAIELADVADAITLPRFRALDLAVETKTDLTPVTDADRAAEEALRAALAQRRPEDGVLGEEGGETAGRSGRRWILDPVDGTKNYSRGIPVWATLIALEADGDVVAGVVSAPALHRRWWASRGGGAFADGQRLRVSAVERVEDAVVSFTRSGLAAGTGTAELVRRAWHARTFSDFWSHVLVAEGSVDVALEPVMNVWDVAPIRVIVEEAGGRVTDDRGGPHIHGGPAVSTNGVLHEEVLAALR